MIDAWLRQLFRQFTECARAELEMPDTVERAATPPSSASGDFSNARVGADRTRAVIPRSRRRRGTGHPTHSLLIRTLWNAIKRWFGRGT
jgi:hypothetical protein